MSGYKKRKLEAYDQIMDGKWHDIGEIEKFKRFDDMNIYMIYVRDEKTEHYIESEHVEACFGIAVMPKNTKRFFCVPLNPEQE